MRDILSAKDAQVAAIVQVVRHVDPDVLVLGDIDYDYGSVALSALADNIGGFPYRLARVPNRGQQSGFDLDGDGRTGRPDDAWGYGEFAGQGGLAVLSKLPLGTVEDFSAVRWKDMPDALALEDTHPDQPLSTTSHWSVPLALPGGRSLTLLTWHATAPVFDGPEDRNGRRNHDEAAFWLEHLRSMPPGDFVVAGFANSDPFDGDGRSEALNGLLTHPLINDVLPKSEGAVMAAKQDGGVNKRHQGPAQFDTADWPDTDGPGNLRVDYVLPSTTLEVVDAGVFWPAPDQLLGSEVMRASRHRLVWLDVRLPER